MFYIVRPLTSAFRAAIAFLMGVTLLVATQPDAYAHPDIQTNTAPPAAPVTTNTVSAASTASAPSTETGGIPASGTADGPAATGTPSEISGVTGTGETTSTFLPFFDLAPSILPEPTTTSIPEQALETAKKYNIPPKLFFALIQQESGWNYMAVSRAGAVGLTQVMPFNLEAWGYDIEAFKNSPTDQLDVGAKYLSKQYQKFGSWDLALAAYNAGPGAVRRYGGIPPYPETQNYVKRILGMSQDGFSWL